MRIPYDIISHLVRLHNQNLSQLRLRCLYKLKTESYEAIAIFDQKGLSTKRVNNLIMNI